MKRSHCVPSLFLVFLALFSFVNCDMELAAKVKRSVDIRDYLDHIGNVVDEFGKQLEKQKLDIASIRISQQNLHTKVNAIHKQVANATEEFEQSLEMLEMRTTTRMHLLDTRVKKNEAAIKSLKSQHNLDTTKLQVLLENFQNLSSTPPPTSPPVQIERCCNAANLTALNWRLGSALNAIAAIEEQLDRQASTAEEIEATVTQNLSGFSTKLATMQNQIEKFSTAVPKHRARIALFDHTGHTGPTETIDFANCFVTEECCKNLAILNNAVSSLNTRGTCVVAYADENCRGEFHTFKPEEPSEPDIVKHWNLESWKDKISSVKPCSGQY